MTVVRIGLVGYGKGGSIFHAPFIASAPECEFAGVVTRSAERRAELAADHPGVPAYDSLADLVAAGVDAVAISTPAATHIELAQQALRSGARRGVRQAVRADPGVGPGDGASWPAKLGRVLTVYQNRRFDSDFLTLRRLIADGSLGDVHRFESRFERFSPDPGPGAAGGGGLWDLGSHLVDQAMQLFGPVATVYAEAHVRDDSGLDDDTFVALTHQQRGALAPVDELAPGQPRAAPARVRQRGDVHSGRARRPGGGADRRPHPGLARRRLGRRAGLRLGAAVTRGAESEPVPSERGRWDTFYPAFAAAVAARGRRRSTPATCVQTTARPARRPSQRHLRPRHRHLYAGLVPDLRGPRSAMTLRSRREREGVVGGSKVTATGGTPHGLRS